MTSDSSKLQQRITVLEDELNLIKSEIHQTLIDMRDAMSKGQDILSVKKESSVSAAQSTSSNDNEQVSDEVIEDESTNSQCTQSSIC